MKINKSEIECSNMRSTKRNEVAVINLKPILGIKDGDDIPEWLLIEVLIRLPVKLIFRLKIVCKHWLSLISDPSFVRMYISRFTLLQPLQPWVIVSEIMRFDCPKKVVDFFQFESVENIYSRELKSPSYLQLHLPCTEQPQRKNFKTYGISNGLVLCAKIGPDSYYYLKSTATYNICNPVTGQWITVPQQTCQFEKVHVGFLTQVEDGMLKSYRVVCLEWPSPKTNTTRFHVFFSESGEWKDFSISSNLEIEIMGFSPPTDLHGNLHWILRNGILAHDPYRKPDDLRIISLPHDKDQEHNRLRGNSLCGVSRGKLRYCKLSLLSMQHLFLSFEIWILNDYNSGEWSLQNRIGRFDILCEVVLRSLSMFILPISFDPFDLDIVYLGYTNIIISYNIKTTRLEAHGHPLSVRQMLDRDPIISYYELPCSSGRMFLIPPWPTFIPPPSRSIDK